MMTASSATLTAIVVGRLVVVMVVMDVVDVVAAEKPVS